MSRPSNKPKTPSEDAVREDEEQYGSGALTLEELNEQFPNRPRNHSQTFFFSELLTSLFYPLNENKQHPTKSALARGRGAGGGGGGGHAGAKASPYEQRRHIIERFMSRWRTEVGPDFYPALRLILPDKDRERGVYGLKESAIAKLLVKLMKIDRNSEDALNLLHWKLPGQTTKAGDFAGRCFEVLRKRQMRSGPGDMRIGEVNVLLDRLAAARGEAEQLPIFETFYRRMTAGEMEWLVRIVLKEMKVGASERTFLEIWHPNGEALFSVSSSLRRVCWELYSPEISLLPEEESVTLMQCFQPQLAAFQETKNFETMLRKLNVSGGGTSQDPRDSEFWIEEKLDGERMQMHMREDDTVPGGFRFAFWSRKAKDYTYLYGNGLEDDNSALTRHLKNAFAEGVRNLILDGEMITWDPETNKIVAFGTLKTAALEQQKNPFQQGPRPVYRVFDILLLNDKNLTVYDLRTRREALRQAVRGEPQRLEIHKYEAATSPDAIEPRLREVVAEASEGLVLKNPRSRYTLNSRNHDWIKVKPEYMEEFGESLDCVVIGGYFGSGHRGGRHSSYLCGLRVSPSYARAGTSPEKCFSFFKVGGGFRAEDYAEIRHHTEGKWVDWDRDHPPTEFIELGGGPQQQLEKPDQWIRPRDSVVVEAKAASIVPSGEFALGWTLRFPRFRRLRLDRAWDSALDVDAFEALRGRVDHEARENKEMNMETRRRRPTKRAKRELVVAGTDPSATPAAGFDDDARAAHESKVFEGLTFCVLSESTGPGPAKKSKTQLEQLIKQHGGGITQRPRKEGGMIVVSDRNVVTAASLKKEGTVDIVRPKWILDCLAQSGGETLLPLEEGHLFYATAKMADMARKNCDRFGDSFARDVTVEELAQILRGMPKREEEEEEQEGGFEPQRFLDQLEEHGHDLHDHRVGAIFKPCRVYFIQGPGVDETEAIRLKNYVRFGAGKVAEELSGATHVVVMGDDAAQTRELAAEARRQVSDQASTGVPRLVGLQWVEDCWRECTLVDEERYAP